MDTSQQRTGDRRALKSLVFLLLDGLRKQETRFSDAVDKFFDAFFTAIQNKYENIRSITLLQIVELVLRPKGFAFLRESTTLLELLSYFTFECLVRRRSPHHIAQQLSKNTVFLQYCTDYLPNVSRWYQNATLAYNENYATLIKYRDNLLRSPSIFGTTPSEAARVHKAETARGNWRHRPAEGYVVWTDNPQLKVDLSPYMTVIILHIQRQNWCPTL